MSYSQGDAKDRSGRNSNVTAMDRLWPCLAGCASGPIFPIAAVDGRECCHSGSRKATAERLAQRRASVCGLELMSYTGKVGRFAWLSLRLTYASKHRAIDCFLGLLIQLRTVKRGA